jgi:hypothetical protein
MALTDVHVIKARIALGMSQRQFGELFGVVKRTVQRWEDGGTTLTRSSLATLTAAVHRRDPALAAALAAGAGATLVELGVEKPPAPPALPPAPSPAPPPPPPPLPMATLIDSIVCVAADAIGVAPSAIRPALAAAFVRAREVRLDLSAVADALTEGEAKGKRRGGRP